MNVYDVETHAHVAILGPDLRPLGTAQLPGRLAGLLGRLRRHGVLVKTAASAAQPDGSLVDRGRYVPAAEAPFPLLEAEFEGMGYRLA